MPAGVVLFSDDLDPSTVHLQTTVQSGGVDLASSGYASLRVE